MQASKSTIRLALVILYLTAWALPLTWVALVPQPGAEYKGYARTDRYLRQANKVIESFLREYKETPFSFAELRAFAKVKKMPFHSYDGFGGHFDYLRLSNKDYILRSFGDDGKQNTVLTHPDPSLVSWQSTPAPGLIYTYLHRPYPGLYPAALLAGAESPNHIWVAQVVSDRAQAARHLLVRHKVSEKFFLVAPHDGVEEFLWMPNGYQIVFTATSSGRYKDGVYLWNLLDDSIENLLTVQADEQYVNASLGTQKDVYLSLAGVSISGPTIYIYLADRVVAAIDPQKFHTASNFLAISVPDDQPKHEKLGLALSEDQKSFHAFLKQPNLSESIENKSLTRVINQTNTQQQWLQLPLKGPIEDVISAWQMFAEKNPDSPLFPYALWYIAVLYNEAYAATKDANPRDGDILRAFGAEISNKLAQTPLAPTYLRGTAFHIYNQLMAMQPLEIKIAQWPVLQPPPPPESVKGKKALKSTAKPVPKTLEKKSSAK